MEKVTPVRRSPGYVIRLDSTGRTGRTYHKDPLVNGKQPIYLFPFAQAHGQALPDYLAQIKERIARKGFRWDKMLVPRTAFTVIGFID